MRRFLAALALVLLPVAVFAQQPPTRDPQAIAVLRAALAAMGGAGAAAIQDAVVQANVTSSVSKDAPTGTVTIRSKGTTMVRTDNSTGGQTSTVIFNNGREFRSSAHGMVLAPSGNSEHKRIEHLPALMLANELVRADFSAVYVGEESLAGRTVHHLQVSRLSIRGAAVDAMLTKNSGLDIYVDTQTSQVTKISFPYVSEMDWRRSLPMEIDYDDYRPVNGILVPFHQRYIFNGQPICEMQITSVAVNQGTPDSVFSGSQQ